MCEVTTYSPLQRYRADPTRTTTLRNAFARTMKNKFRALTGVIQEAVVTQDVFGLGIQVNVELRPPGYHAFDFPRLSQKVDAFMQWLRLQEDKGLLELGNFTRLGGAIEDSWMNVYLLDSYKRGVIRARSELKKAGYKVPTIAESGGVEVIMGGLFHVDSIGYVYTRAFEQLKGITSAMDTQISQVLAQGLIDGDHPSLLSRKLRATINGTGAGDLGITDTLGRFIPAQRRADMLARTEIIRAHHMANIQEYMNWRAMGVSVMAEWSTSGGNRVCERCASMEGKRFELEEIQNMIPRHPLCRCVAVPMEVDPNTQEPIEY